MNRTRVNRLLSLLIALCMGGCSTLATQGNGLDLTAAASGEAQYAIATRNDRMGRIVVPVSINGIGVFHLMLDTGATHSVLTSAAASRLGVNVIDARTSMVQGVAGRAAAPIVLIDDMQAGALKLRDVRVAVMDGVVISELDGILGVDGLGDKVITADFANDRINIRNSTQYRLARMDAVIKFELISNKLIIVNGKIGKVPVRAIIDTGGTQSVANAALLKAIMNQRDGRTDDEETGIIDITDNSKRGTVLFVPRIRLGAATITNATIICSDFEVFRAWNLDTQPAILIGMDVLGQLKQLSIDYQRQELRLGDR